MLEKFKSKLKPKSKAQSRSPCLCGCGSKSSSTIAARRKKIVKRTNLDSLSVACSVSGLVGSSTSPGSTRNSVDLRQLILDSFSVSLAGFSTEGSGSSLIEAENVHMQILRPMSSSKTAVRVPVYFILESIFNYTKISTRSCFDTELGH